MSNKKSHYVKGAKRVSDMDEYIKREDAMKALEEYRLSHTMSMHGDRELLMEFRDGVIGAMNAISFVPASDVVPKSEVAREIFEEIEKALNLSKCYGDSGIYFECDIENDIAELKKKYTEGQK